MNIINPDTGTDGAGGAVEPKVEVFSQEELNPTNDPYDIIEDEVARNEAKKLRAITRRQEKKAAEEPKKVETPPVAPDNFATKDDLKLMATNAAKDRVAPEVKALWDELVAIPLGGFDPMSADSIAANMAKRYALYKIENPDKTDDPANPFKASPDIQPGGNGTVKQPPKATEVKLPGYKEPVPPTEWYK